MRKVALFYRDIEIGGSSDKTYLIQLEAVDSGFTINFQYGRRGGVLQAGTKTPEPVPLDEANQIFDRLVTEKTSKGYKAEAEYACAGPTVLQPKLSPAQEKITTKYPVELLDEIDLRECNALLRSPDYYLQVKVDGHRRQIEKLEPGSYASYNKKGNLVTTLPAEVVHDLSHLNVKTFLIDGELLGNSYVAYDLLMLNGTDYSERPYAKRFEALLKLITTDKWRVNVTTVATWKSTKQKIAAMDVLLANRCEGAVFKLASAPYRPGRQSHRKYKFIKSASCKVTAVGKGGKDNAVLALFEEGRWTEVAHVSTIGKGAIAVGDVVETLFLYVTEGRRLYQPRIKEVRHDVDAAECTMAQLKGMFKEGVKEAA